MRSTTISFLILAAVLYFSSTVALAQRGHGAGSHPGGGPGASGMPGRPTGAEAGPGAARPEMGHPEAGRGGRAAGRTEETHAGGRLAVADHLAQNTRLSSKLEGLLPPGTNLQNAAAGFKNLGEFVAAAHVSHNLGIPFDQLRGKLVSGKSLGEAIHELRPDANHKDEVKKAKEQASKDMKAAGL